jgi:hypothetical protein
MQSHSNNKHQATMYSDKKAIVTAVMVLVVEVVGDAMAMAVLIVVLRDAVLCSMAEHDSA